MAKCKYCQDCDEIVLWKYIISFYWILKIQGEDKIIPYNEALKPDVVTVGHHVSNTSLSNYFIQRAFPKFAVISVEYKSIFRHPNKNFMNRIIKHAGTIYRIGQSRAMRLQSGGSIIWEVHWK